MTRLSTSSRSNDRLIGLVMSRSMRSLSTTDRPAAFWIVSGIRGRPPETVSGFQLYVLSACHRSSFVVRPEVSDLDPVFSQLPAEPKVTCDLVRRSAFHNETSQRSIRYQRGGADGVSSLFVRLVVIARHQFAGGFPFRWRRLFRPSPVGEGLGERA